MSFDSTAILHSRNREGGYMDWNSVESNWKQLTEKIKERWGKLADTELDNVGGDREQLSGKIQKEFDSSKAEQEERIGSFTANVNQPGCGCSGKESAKR